MGQKEEHQTERGGQNAQGSGTTEHTAGEMERPVTWHREPAEAHPQQLRPTAFMYNLAMALFQRRIEDWKIEDVYTPNSSDGTSVLLSAFVDQAVMVFKTDMTPPQTLRLAQAAARTAPKRLLDMLKDSKKARGYIKWALDGTTVLPPTHEDELCPALTPGLFTPDENSVLNSTYPLRSDQIHTIEIFLKCFYPRITPIARTHLEQLEASTLTRYITVPGEIKRSMIQATHKLPFSPPNWYRLSTPPSRVLHSTPRKDAQRTEQWSALPITLTDVQSKLDIPLHALRQKPFETQRTTLLSIIPLLFEDRVSREGRLETIALFDTATTEELGNFLHEEPGESRIRIDTTTTLETTPPRLSYQHCLRFEHIDRRNGGGWTEAAESILSSWILGVLPALEDKNHNMFLTASPFARIQEDRLLSSTTFDLTQGELSHFIHVKTKQTMPNLSRFDVWIKSTCEHIGELTELRNAGSAAEGYSKILHDLRLQVESITRSEEGMVPVILLVGSIETESNMLVVEELNDRLAKSGVLLEDCPSFYIAYTPVSTSAGRPSVMAKCVVAHRDNAIRLHELFATINTPPPLKSRYLVTKEYSFTQIHYPATPRSDRTLRTALARQKDYIASLTKTTIHGVTGTDPFFDTPRQTRDMCNGMIHPNEKSVAQLILTEKTLDIMGYQIDSPVGRVSMNPKGSKIYLTALKADAKELVRFTAEVVSLFDIWYQGKYNTIYSDCTDAERHGHSLSTTQSNTVYKLLPDETPHSDEDAKDDLDQELTDLAQQARQDLNTTFVHSSEQSENARGDETQDQRQVRLQADIADLRHTITCQQSILTEVFDMMKVLVSRIPDKGVLIPDIVHTITTTAESCLNSSLTSATQQALTQCESYFTDQSKRLDNFMANKEQQIAQMGNDAKEHTAMLETFKTILTENVERMDRTQKVVTEIHEQNTTLLRMIESNKQGLSEAPDRTLATHSPNLHDGDDIAPDASGDNDTETGLDDYSLEIRRRARGVLELMQTMPMRSPPDLTLGNKTANPDTPDARAPTALGPVIPKVICCACKKEDVGLLFCDTCPDTSMQLYHPECLTFDPSTKKRMCEYCSSCARETKEDDGVTSPDRRRSGERAFSTTSDMINSSPRKETKSPVRASATENAMTTRATLPTSSTSPSSTSSSSSSSSATSSSTSSVDSSKPTKQEISKKGFASQRTPPNLVETTHDTDKPKEHPTRNNETAPKVRSSARLLKLAKKDTGNESRERKKPADAYDSPDEEESDMDTATE